MAKAGVITVNLNAGTAQFIVDMDRANAKVRDFGNNARAMGGHFQQAGAHTVSGMQAASGSIRLLEGNINNNIRAVENFISKTLRLGPVLQAAFPVVGALAFFGIIAEKGEELIKFLKDVQAAPGRINGAFRELNSAINISNDELRVTDDRLKNEIAKLEGKPQNNLKLALHEVWLESEKLAASLNKDFVALQALLEKENVGFARRMFGEAGTEDIQEKLGGKTGFDGVRRKLDDTDDEFEPKIRAAKDAKAAQVLTDQKNAQKKTYLAQLAADTDKEIEIIQKREKANAAILRTPTVNPVTGTISNAAVAQGSVDLLNASARLAMLRGVRDNARAEISKIDLTRDVTVDTKKKEDLTAKAENAKVGQPFQNEIDKLTAAYKGAVEKLNASGMSESAKTLAKAHAEAFKAITEVNKQLKEHHSRLTEAQGAQIRGLLVQTVTTEAEATWRENLAKSSGEIQNRIRSQEMLTAAIGKGYAATKAANVETQLMQAVGPERFNDDEFMQTHARGVNRLRSQIGTEFDKQNAQQIAKATDALQDQIELEKSLAAVQSAGADAINRVTLAYRLREIAMRGGLSATKEQIKAEMDLFETRRATQSEKDLAGLNLEISGLQRLSAAQIQGAEAARQAAVANEAARLKFEGKSDAVVGAFLQKAELEHQTAILDAVLKTSNAARARLAELASEESAARSLKGTEADQLGLAIKLKEIDRERVAILSQQVQVFGSAKDGMRVFFAEMATQSMSAARMVHDTLGNAFNSLNDTLAKVMTGQKVSWSSFFRQIGEDMSKLAIHQLEVEAVKKIGAIITARQQSKVGQKKGPMDKVMDAVNVALGGSSAVKRDGNTEATALYVSIVGAGGLPSGAVPLGQSASTKGAGGPDGSDKNPFSVLIKTSAWEKIGGAFKDLAMSGAAKLPHRATGGPVDAGYSYMVGERGPEMFTPTGAGTIVPNNALGGRAAGGNIYYHVDARDSNEVAVERRVRTALAATHKSAVITAMRAMTEQSRRMPRHA